MCVCVCVCFRQAEKKKDNVEECPTCGLSAVFFFPFATEQGDKVPSLVKRCLGDSRSSEGLRLSDGGRISDTDFLC